MDIAFIVKFTPEEMVDYMFDLICITEREKFCVPIKAIGARGLLDIPDQVTFPECPVRFSSTKTLLVRNIGDSPAKFTIEAPKPFSVEPSSGFLECDKLMQLELKFNPRETGTFSEEMLVKYNTGEVMAVSLSGLAENMNIKLEKNLVTMENTWISLNHSQKFKIFNKSDLMVDFIDLGQIQVETIC